MLLAIETSCDETAVALLDQAALEAGQQDAEEFLLADVIASQTSLHQEYGGVVPELAAREHIINLPLLVDQTLKEHGVGPEEIQAVAVTRGPGLKGCLLVGLCFAKSFAYSRGIPLLALNHIEGHIFAGELLSSAQRPKLPMLALVVSGGHTMLVYISGFRQYRIIATTRDDAAGEAFDKGATLMGLPYPGGPSLAGRAEQGDPHKYDFPVGVPQDPSSFSFSGLKTAVLRTICGLGVRANETAVVHDLAASLQYAIVRALTEKSVAACKALKPRSFLLTGGVAANKCLRSSLKDALEDEGVMFCVPPQRWCTDNAAMIGMLACRIIENSPRAYREWSKDVYRSGLLGPDTKMDIGALPRWPLDQLVGKSGPQKL